MVQIDTRLPMMIQQPNVLAALDAGTQAAGNQNALMRQAEGQNLFRQYGAGAMQGDQNALAQIARFDPMMGQGMATTQQENRRADQRLGMERERLGITREHLELAKTEMARAVAAAEDKAGAEAQVRMMERAFREMDVARRTGDMAAVSQGLRMFGLEELDPEEGMQLAATYLAGGIEGLAGNYMPKQGDPTSGMREYELARSQGFEGSFVDYQRQLAEARRSQTNVTVDTGSAPRPELLGTQGLVAIPDSSDPTGFRVEPAPGSPIAEERAAAAAKRGESDRQQNRKLDGTLGLINLNIAEIENGGLPVTGPIGEARRTGLGRLLTGSAAVDVQNRTDAITDGAAFAEIQNMRDNSPTGGAVGQLTDPERRAIGNSVTALNTATSEAEYLRAARTYRDLALDLAYGEGNWRLDPQTGDVSLSVNGTPSAGGASADGLSPDEQRVFELYRQ